MSRDTFIGINQIILTYMKPDTSTSVEVVEFRYVQHPKHASFNIYRCTHSNNYPFLVEYIEGCQSKYIYQISTV